jgi:hypothetical protein
MSGRYTKAQLQERVSRAAAEALEQQQWVGPIDVMTRIGWLSSSVVDAWRRGLVPCLEDSIQCGDPSRLELCLGLLEQWALNRSLKPAEANYRARTRSLDEELRCTRSGNPEMEQRFRTHFVAADLSPAATERVQKKLTKQEDLVVFQIVRDSQCSECGVELLRDDFLFKEKERVLCMACADLDELVFLPSGDAAVTRRARKYSKLAAVVVRFSRSRGRYERQGLLVNEEAIEQAETECLADAEMRERRRERSALRAAEQDQELTAAMTAKIMELFPGCPPSEAHAIAAHTTVRSSGRVGRSAQGRALDDNSVTLAVVASVRHRHTNYDELLMSGVDRENARNRIREKLEDILDSWRG